VAKKKPLGYFFRTLVASFKQWNRLPDLAIYRTQSKITSSQFILGTDSRRGTDAPTVIVCYGIGWEDLSVNKTDGGVEIAFHGSLERDEFFEFISIVHEKIMSDKKSKRPHLRLVKADQHVVFDEKKAGSDKDQAP
jgi:hypothetical protein